MMSRNFLLMGALTCAMAAWTQNASAQTTHTGKFIILENILPIANQAQKAGNAAIPLDPALEAEVNADGDIVVRCKTGTDGAQAGACSNVGGGGGTLSHVPTITFAGPTGVVPAGNTGARLHWSTTNAGRCFGVSSNPQVSGWNGAQLTSTTSSNGFLVGNLSRSTTSNTSYEFVLGCYSAQIEPVGGQQAVAYKEAAKTVVLAPAVTQPDPQDFCEAAYPIGHAARSQPGFTTPLTRVNATFAGEFGIGFAQLVRDGGNGEAIISTSVVGEGQYMAIPLDMPADMPNLQGTQYNWTNPQNGGLNTGIGFEMTFSPCPGDFRKHTNTMEEDPWSNYNCRTNQPSTGGTWVGNSGVGAQRDPTGVCHLPKGKRIYMNITFHKLENFRRSGAPPEYLCVGAPNECGTKIQASRSWPGQ